MVERRQIMEVSAKQVVELLDTFTKKDRCAYIDAETFDYLLQNNQKLTEKICGQYYLDDCEAYWGFNP